MDDPYKMEKLIRLLSVVVLCSVLVNGQINSPYTITMNLSPELRNEKSYEVPCVYDQCKLTALETEVKILTPNFSDYLTGTLLSCSEEQQLCTYTLYCELLCVRHFFNDFSEDEHSHGVDVSIRISEKVQGAIHTPFLVDVNLNLHRTIS